MAPIYLLYKSVDFCRMESNMGGFGGMAVSPAARPLLPVMGILMIIIGLLVYFVQDFLELMVAIMFILQGIFFVAGYFMVKPQ